MVEISQHCPKRFHVTLQVPNLKESMGEYSAMLGEQPCYIVKERLALWRTGELNLLLYAKPKRRTAVLQFGWEFAHLDKSSRLKDGNQLSWLLFSTETQNEALKKLGSEAQYRQGKDFFLELRNPRARWRLWTSLALLAALLLLFTALQSNWLRPLAAPQLQESPDQEAQQLYSNKAQLQIIGKLLLQAGYTVDELDNYAVARHPKQASITIQVVEQQILFSTYWALPEGERASAQDTNANINKINREAIMCRYYLDEEGELAVEAWLYLPPLLMLAPELFTEAPSTPALEARQTNSSVGAAQNDSLQFDLNMARWRWQWQWQKSLRLWQQESLSWLQNSALFGGELQARQSFSKR